MEGVNLVSLGYYLLLGGFKSLVRVLRSWLSEITSLVVVVSFEMVSFISAILTAGSRKSLVRFELD